MFEDSFLEDNPKLRSHRPSATVISFVIQGLILAVLAMLPLLAIQSLPTRDLMATLILPPPPPPPPPPPAGMKAASVKPQRAPVVKSDELHQPLHIPEKIAMIKDEPTPTEQGPPSMATGGVVGGVPGGVPGGVIGGVLGGVVGAAPVPMPKAVTPQRVRISQGVSQGLLIHKVMPEYPSMAREAHVQGTVVLQAQISKDGHIEKLKALSGPEMLKNAALEAVRQWRYKPYYLNGQPVEVDTVISVNFVLSGAAG